jgi:hypothetical protein
MYGEPSEIGAVNCVLIVFQVWRQHCCSCRGLK